MEKSTKKSMKKSMKKPLSPDEIIKVWNEIEAQHKKMSDSILALNRIGVTCANEEIGRLLNALAKSEVAEILQKMNCMR